MKFLFLLDEITLGQEPLGVTTIGALLKQHGCEVDYWRFEKEGEANTLNFVDSFKPSIIAHHVTTGTHNSHLRINTVLKKKYDFLSYFGGPHVTYFPEFINKEGVDVICQGEGEYPTLELVQAYEKHNDFTNIQNLWIKHKGGIVKNSCRPFIKNLDALPFPDRKGILQRCPHLKKGNLLYIIAGRGCPYNCNFCFNHVLKTLQPGQYLRWRSVDNVIAEIQWSKQFFEFGAVAFQDDTFILNKEWLFEFAEKYPQQVGLPYLCHVRADLSTPDIVEALKSSGCKRAAIGIESGNDTIRNSIMHKQITTEQLQNAGKLYHEAGIELVGQNLFAAPKETVETALQTIELNIDMKIHCTVIHFFQPYPKTVLGEMANDLGLYDVSIDNLPPSNHWGPTLKLQDSEIIGRIGLLIYMFLDYPLLFRITKPLLLHIKCRNFRLFILKSLQKLEMPLRKITKNTVGSRWHPYYV